jgi:hypothetical protein
VHGVDDDWIFSSRRKKEKKRKKEPDAGSLRAVYARAVSWVMAG